MAYDRIDWHSGGDFPAELPDENGGTHIGMFLAWMLGQGMAGELHREDSQAWLADLAARRITGRDFLLQACDSKFWDEDLDEAGNAFAADYYGGDSAFARAHGGYMADYCEVFNAHAAANGFEYPSTYHVEDSWENFDRLAPLIAQRHAQWLAWRVSSGQAALDPKAQFLAACNSVGEVLAAQGFKPSRGGAVWKKTAADRDTQFEVLFEPVRYNSRANVKLTMHLYVSSRQLGRWRSTATGGADRRGDVLSGSCRRADRSANVIEWQVAGQFGEASLQAMRRWLGNRALPLFDLFADRSAALAHLATQGAGFAEISEDVSAPLAFLLCFGTREQAQAFFDHYARARPGPWRRNIATTFQQLRDGAPLDWMHSAYVAESDVKLAFASGLVLPGAERPA